MLGPEARVYPNEMRNGRRFSKRNTARCGRFASWLTATRALLVIRPSGHDGSDRAGVEPVWSYIPDTATLHYQC